MISGDKVKALFASEFEAAGFRRRRSTWYRIGDDVTFHVGLQKSQWSEKYYVNIGFLLHALGSEKILPDHKTHIRGRAENVLPDDLETIRTALCLDLESWSEERHISEIRRVLHRIVPYGERRASAASLAIELRDGKLADLLVSRAARDFLQGMDAR